MAIIYAYTYIAFVFIDLALGNPTKPRIKNWGTLVRYTH